MTRMTILVAAAALAGCSAGDQTTGSNNFDVRETGAIGTGRLYTETAIITDRETGCEYLASAYQEVHLTPRLDSTGRPMCATTAIGDL